MAEQPFDNLFDKLNSLSPKLKPEPGFVLPAENILDLTLISSASDPNDSKIDESEKVPDNQIFLSDDKIFGSELNEIKIDSKPLDFTEITPKSVSIESHTSTPQSNQDQVPEALNYSNFESATFKNHMNRDSLDSVEYLNLELDGPRTQTGKTSPPLEKPKQEDEENKSEFAKFYNNLYYNSLHGPPVVGAFIVRNKDSKNEFLVSYPNGLDPKRPSKNENLKATFSSTSYTAERNHTSELQSSLHLLPDLAFGSQKKNSLVDFVHFVLPTSSGNVLYGTSYVLQLTEKVETYGSLLNLINENLRKEPGKNNSSSTYFDPRSPPPSATTPLKTLKQTTAKTLEFFNSVPTTLKSTQNSESKEKVLNKGVELLELNSPQKKVETEKPTKSTTLKELDFLNFEPVPIKPEQSTSTKKSEFKPFDLFNLNSSPTKNEEQVSKSLESKACSGSCDASPKTTNTNIFSLIDFDDKNKKETDEKGKNKEENKLFGVFSELNLKKNWFGDEEEKKENNKKDNKMDKNEKEKEDNMKNKKNNEKMELEEQEKNKFNQKINFNPKDKNEKEKDENLVKPNEEDKNHENKSIFDIGKKFSLNLEEQPEKSNKELKENKDPLFDLGYKTNKEFGFDLAKKLGWKIKTEQEKTNLKSESKNDEKNNSSSDNNESESNNEKVKLKLDLKNKHELEKKLNLEKKVTQDKKFDMGKSYGLDRFNEKVEMDLAKRLSVESKSINDTKTQYRMGLGIREEKESKVNIEKKLSFDLKEKLNIEKKENKNPSLNKDNKVNLNEKLSGENIKENKENKKVENDKAIVDGSGSEKQIKKEEPELYTRYYVAICLIYKVPFFGVIGSRLEYVAQTYFEDQNFKDKSLLLSFVDHINKNDKPEDWSYESLFFNLEYHFKPFSLCLSYRAMLFLLKSVLAEQRIAIYSECAARTSTCILSLLTMIPCANALNFNSKTFGSLWYSWKKYGFPLDLFRQDNPIYPYFTESMVTLLDDTSGYLIGITDLKIIRKFKEPPTLIFDLEDEAIKLRTRDLLGFYSPSFYEISFFNDFEIFEDMEIDDEPLKMVLDTSENIFHFVGDYLSKAPSTIIHLGGKASKIYHIGRSLGSRRHKESYLRLFDVYFPGALPKFLRFSKKQVKPKRCDNQQPGSPIMNAEDDGEDDLVGNQERVTKYQKKKKVDPLEELKAQWDKVMESEVEETKVTDVNMIDEMVEGEMNQPAFTFSVMFEKMRRRGMKYRYLGYIQTLQSDELYNRMKEIEYSIFTKIQPLRDFLLKFLKSSAYAGGKRRLSYQLVMDFTFDLDSMVDFNNPVDGTYIVRDGKFLRGCMQEEPDSDEEDPEVADEINKKSYLMEGDEEVVTKVPAMLATFILELHNNYSVDFFELWIQTKNFNEFFKNHNLEVFNEPVFYLSNNLAKYTYPNGDFYVGELSDMLRDGKGSYVSKDGSRYDGTWKRDKRHGKGTLITNDAKYTGEWINDKKHGFGRLETQGYSYVGDFRLNKYHGNGTMLFKSGVKLKGEFRNGKFEGKGIMNLPDGSIRMGTFRDGVITGVCSVIDKDGRVYVGQLYGDQFHGKGVLKYNKQTSFEGFWVKGKREKQGMIINKVAGSVIRIEGVWENDNMLMNEVLITFPNGYKYNGSLRYFPTADIDLNQFKEDRDFKTMDPIPSDIDIVTFLQDFKRLNNRLLPHGTGICKDTNGGVYNGSFYFGSRHGRTSQVFPNGFIYSGEYYLGKFHGNSKIHMQSDESISLEYEKGTLLNKAALEGTEVLEQLLNYEVSLFEKNFTRYKLDFLVEVMKSTVTLQNVTGQMNEKANKTVDDLIPLS